MEIQQHDGVVVDATEILQGFAKHRGRRERCNGGREALGARVRLPSPPLYIGALGGAVLGNVAEFKKIPTLHQDQSKESSSNEHKRVHLHTLCRSQAEAFKRTWMMESYSS